MIDLKCGIEIHQRLAGKKLFCACDGESASGKPLFEIRRMQHAVLSELGESDKASEFESARRREFIYHVYDNDCPVELDEEPPHRLNGQALDTALEIALMLNSKPVDEIEVMRKAVVDGSNTGGFQRTAVIAVGGSISANGAKIGIQTIALEEESAGIVEEKAGTAVFRLDRLGIPLVEIATDPDITSPEQARTVAEAIGTLLRMTGKVARGIGTIRQDINISIEGGARVELKGAQDLALIGTIVQKEIERQKGLIELRPKIEAGKTQQLKIVDLTQHFKATEAKLAKRGLEEGASILGFRLAGYAGVLGHSLSDGRRFGTEVSDYAKRAGVGGLIHGDETFDKYGFSEYELAEVRKALGVHEGDSFVMVIAEEQKARKALELAFSRAIRPEVPEETRKVLPEGLSSFMRPLAGGGRMYPETDVSPIRLTSERLARIRSSLSQKPEEKKSALLGMLNEELANKMMRSRHLHFFEKLAKDGTDPVLIATTLEETLVSLRRSGVEVEKISEERLRELFNEYGKGRFVKAAIPDILTQASKDVNAKIAEIVKALDLSRISGAELKKLAAGEGNDLKRVMAKYRLRVDAKELSELIGTH
ncbi:MAG: Glu-tRNA(Gln) amidotransferase subunit GatE [Candidatus Burarchaeum sp.]|nr:Glu-tRNA(Gln) amidotransferase subunit GatE [Candidatus Burarchaeum sp.]MDO8339701.1 Glu-tRNA(Gln) amidotransferase subunit GatE [Candidatus Burarchaeum sp.]